jgi:hypothetical protein
MYSKFGAVLERASVEYPKPALNTANLSYPTLPPPHIAVTYVSLTEVTPSSYLDT